MYCLWGFKLGGVRKRLCFPSLLATGGKFAGWGEERGPLLFLGSALRLRLLRQRPVVVLSRGSSISGFRAGNLVVLMVVVFNTRMFMPVTQNMLLRRTNGIFRVFLLISFRITTRGSGTPIKSTTGTTAMFPRASMWVRFTCVSEGAGTINIICSKAAISMARSLARVRVRVVGGVKVIRGGLGFSNWWGVSCELGPHLHFNFFFFFLDQLTYVTSSMSWSMKRNIGGPALVPR